MAVFPKTMTFTSPYSALLYLDDFALASISVFPITLPSLCVATNLSATAGAMRSGLFSFCDRSHRSSRAATAFSVLPVGGVCDHAAFENKKKPITNRINVLVIKRPSLLFWGYDTSVLQHHFSQMGHRDHLVTQNLYQPSSNTAPLASRVPSVAGRLHFRTGPRTGARTSQFCSGEVPTHYVARFPRHAMSARLTQTVHVVSSTYVFDLRCKSGGAVRSDTQLNDRNWRAAIRIPGSRG